MSEKIKVAEVVSGLSSGGVESMLLNYLKHFKHPERFDIHIITQNRNDERCVKQFQDAGYTVDIVTHKYESIHKNVVELYRLMRSKRFDIVHAHTTLTNFYILWIARFTGTKKLISHSHNSFVSNSKIKHTIWHVLKILNKLSSNIWVACGHDAGVFLYGHKAVRSGKVILLRNAIDTNKFKFDESARKTIRSKYGIEDSQFVIGHIGRFSEQKNHEYLIDIFNEVIRNKPEALLMLVGVGELETKVHQHVDELGLTDKVIFVGSVENANEYYQAMDTFVLPSKYEGLPVVSIEAQTSDLPVLISENVDRSCNITGNIKFLSINDPPAHWADEILSIQRQERSTSVLERIKKAHYSIQEEAEKLESLYEDEHTCSAKGKRRF